ADRRVLTPHEVDQRLEAFCLLGIPDAEIMLVDQADLLDRGGLYKDQPKTSQRIAAEMHMVKHAAGAARTGAVMHHRRHHQAVLQRQTADREGLKQQGASEIDAVGDWG